MPDRLSSAPRYSFETELGGSFSYEAWSSPKAENFLCNLQAAVQLQMRQVLLRMLAGLHPARQERRVKSHCWLSEALAKSAQQPRSTPRRTSSALPVLEGSTRASSSPKMTDYWTPRVCQPGFALQDAS